MRIITGIARGTTLESPQNQSEDVRPTLDRIKENYFNAIHFDVIEKKVLDLFAGTGQLGLEALSRGAREAVFIDDSTENVALIKRNAQKCKLYDKCNVFRYDYGEYINIIKKQKNFEKFGMVFIDPPYNTNLVEESVKKLIVSNVLTEGAVLVLESDKENLNFDESIYDYFDTYKTFKYGTVYITVIRLKNREFSEI